MKKATSAILLAMVLLATTSGVFAASVQSTGNIDEIYANGAHEGR